MEENSSHTGGKIGVCVRGLVDSAAGGGRKSDALVSLSVFLTLGPV